MTSVPQDFITSQLAQIVNAICKDLEMQLVTPLENVLASPISLETNVTSVQQNITILMPIACLVNVMKMVQKTPIVTILVIVLAKKMWLEISVMHLNQDFMACLILYLAIVTMMDQKGLNVTMREFANVAVMW